MICIPLLITMLTGSLVLADQAELLLTHLSLEQKIAQLFIIAVDNSEYINPTHLIRNADRLFNNKAGKFPRTLAEHLIDTYMIGGVHFIGYGTIASSIHAINDLQLRSRLPLLVCQDFEWGLSTSLTDAITFPHAVSLGAITDNNLIYRLGAEIARQCHLLGAHMNFAPVADIQSNPRNPVINARSFGSFSHRVAEKSVAFMRGMQDNGILACPKHFCGHGDVSLDSHYALPTIAHSLQALHHRELYPFKQLIDAGAQAIMAAHMHVPAIDDRAYIPLTLSYTALTGMLQQHFNFSGLIITDALDMKAITDHFKPGELELEALKAGNDLLLMSEQVPLAIETIKQAVLNGTISQSSIDKKVLKLLRAKEKLGLFTSPVTRNVYPTIEQFNSQNAYALQKELYQAAITLIRDRQKLIPIPHHSAYTLVQIGGTQDTHFSKALCAYYTHLDYYYIDKNAPDCQWQELYAHIAASDTIVFAIFDLNKLFDENNGVTHATLSLIDQLEKEHKNIIVALFGYAYSARLFKHIGTVLACYEPDPAAQDACAQVISGKIIAQGVLPIDIPD